MVASTRRVAEVRPGRGGAGRGVQPKVQPVSWLDMGVVAAGALFFISALASVQAGPAPGAWIEGQVARLEAAQIDQRRHRTSRFAYSAVAEEVGLEAAPGEHVKVMIGALVGRPSYFMELCDGSGCVAATPRGGVKVAAEVPPSLAAMGAISFAAKRTNSGTHDAKPSINRNTDASPATRLVPETMITTTAASINTTPANVMAGSAWRARRSRVERESARRG